MLSLPKRSRFLIACLAGLLASPASGQLRDETTLSSLDSAERIEEAQETTLRFRVGAIVTAKRGPCADILGMVAVPIECDEQKVRLVEQDISPNIGGTEFRDLAGGNARLLAFAIPRLNNGAEARVLLTYEVTTRTTPPPADDRLDEFIIPKRVPRNLRGYVGTSPYIESKDRKIKKLAKKIQSDLEEATEGGEPKDWDRLEALYEYVMDNIEYIEGPDTSASTTLKEGSADCHGRSALFVAMCRSMGVPARLVWAQDHCYPEFYVETRDGEAGEGQWLPAESAGTRAFGQMPLARTIMQKGDDFRVTRVRGTPPERLRYATDYLTGRPAVKGAGKPSVKYVREVVQ